MARNPSIKIGWPSATTTFRDFIENRRMDCFSKRYGIMLYITNYHTKVIGKAKKAATTFKIA
ncbi:MAG TPA: hypothetical protein PLW66_13625 [Saprospiraceae bacterium]|nr:hypothetical protein [Saprospiraceae bacterium]